MLHHDRRVLLRLQLLAVARLHTLVPCMLRLHVCPVCGSDPQGTLEDLTGVHVVERQADGTYDHTGELHAHFVEQETRHIWVDGVWVPLAVCASGHAYVSLVLDVEGTWHVRRDRAGRFFVARFDRPVPGNPHEDHPMHGSGMAFFSESDARTTATHLNDAGYPPDARLPAQASAVDVNSLLESFDSRADLDDPLAHLASLLGVEQGALREARARGTSFELLGRWFSALASVERTSD